jgi:hypothetical protein
VFCLTPKQSDRVMNGLVRHPPRPKKLKFHRSRIKTTLIIFFKSQGVVHKGFIPEGKTVNAEFYKEVMDHLLKRIQRVRPAAFCSRDIFCCTIMRPPQSCKCLPVFDPKKCYPLSPPVLYRFISARLLSVPQVENEVKRAPLCGCCSDPVYMTMELILN